LRRILLLSDIHSNLEALDSVLSHAEKLEFNETWIMGDITGYGPEPKACLQKVLSLKNTKFICGNHDRVVSKTVQPLGFNPHAIVAAYKNMQLLDGDELNWLARLPNSLSPCGQVGIFHGSVLDPDEYLLTIQSAIPSLRSMNMKGLILGFFGHTHVPSLFELDENANEFYDIDVRPDFPMELPLDGSRRILINPGSVGQPRDGNPQASFALLEYDDLKAKLTFKRVDYPIDVCQAKLRNEGYPEILAMRLSIGF